MSLYDEQCAEDFARIRNKVEPYFFDLQTTCPYGLPFVATFHQAMFCPIDQRIMELFLAAGYRRNGNCLYSMRCAGCSACIPIRLDARTFSPNRNQRRVARKNSDLAISLEGLYEEEENSRLCRKFLEMRYPQKNNSAEGYYKGFFVNNIVDTSGCSTGWTAASSGPRSSISVKTGPTPSISISIRTRAGGASAPSISFLWWISAGTGGWITSISATIFKT